MCIECLGSSGCGLVRKCAWSLSVFAKYRYVSRCGCDGERRKGTCLVVLIELSARRHLLKCMPALKPSANTGVTRGVQDPPICAVAPKAFAWVRFDGDGSGGGRWCGGFFSPIGEHMPALVVATGEGQARRESTWPTRVS